MQTETTAGKPDDRYKIALTIKEAASASGISRSLLYVAIGQGALRARKFGARTLILDTELRRFLRSLPRLTKGEQRPESAG
jgi:excisionase family DNA binding protein